MLKSWPILDQSLIIFLFPISLLIIFSFLPLLKVYDSFASSVCLALSPTAVLDPYIYPLKTDFKGAFQPTVGTSLHLNVIRIHLEVSKTVARLAQPPF